MLRAIRHDDVTQLEFTTPVTRAFGYRVSAFVVRGVLVDTGFPHAGRALDRWIRASRPRGAFVTHHHEDHAGNVARLARAGVPVGIAQATLERVRRPAPIGLYRRVTWGVAPPLSADPLPFEDQSLRLLPSPGHTADHHVVWDAERETVFGGDLFIGVKVRIGHPNEDVRGEVRSLRAVVALRPRRFFCAHRGPLDAPVAQLSAKADWIEAMIGAVEVRVREGWSDPAIAREVLGPGDLTGLVSAGDYAKLNLVRSIRRSMT